MNEDVELTRGQLLGFIRQGLPLALILAGLFAGILYYWGTRATPAFRAQVALVAKSPQVDLRTLGLPEMNYAPLHVSAYSVAVSSRPLLAAALAEAGLPSGAGAVSTLVDGNLKVDVQPEADLIYVTVTEGTPTQAASLANAIAEQLQTWDRSRISAELQRVASLLTQRITLIQVLLQSSPGETKAIDEQILTSNRQLLNQLSDQREAVLALMSSTPSTLAVLRAATAPAAGITRSPVMLGALGLLLGGLLAYGMTFIVSLFSPRVYTSEGLEHITGLPVIAELGSRKSRQALPVELTIALQANLKAEAHSGDQLTLLVAGLEPRDDSAGAAMVVAESFALRGISTLLVDADIRKPEIAHRYRVRDDSGLSLMSYIRGSQGARRPMTVQLDRTADLSLVYESDSVPNGSVAMLRGLPGCLDEWKTEFECVVLRCSALSSAGDLLMIAGSCDGVVLAVEPRTAKRRNLLAHVTRLRHQGIQLIGTIATGNRRWSRRRASTNAQVPAQVPARAPRPNS